MIVTSADMLCYFYTSLENRPTIMCVWIGWRFIAILQEFQYRPIQDYIQNSVEFEDNEEYLYSCIVSGNACLYTLLKTSVFSCRYRLWCRYLSISRLNLSEQTKVAGSGPLDAMHRFVTRQWLKRRLKGGAKQRCELDELVPTWWDHINWTYSAAQGLAIYAPMKNGESERERDEGPPRRDGSGRRENKQD